MRKLTVSTMVSLDGVMQAPGPNEDSSGGFKHAGWASPYLSEDGFKTTAEYFSRAGGFLLGRKTYQGFAGYWPKMTDPNHPIAGPLNRLPKYVASRTLKKVEWNNSTLLKGSLVGAVKKLKAEEGKELQVHGSHNLLQTLMKARLIDEWRILTIPVVLGKGKRLFGSGTVPGAMELAGSKTTSKGVVIQIYRSAGALKTGTMGK